MVKCVMQYSHDNVEECYKFTFNKVNFTKFEIWCKKTSLKVPETPIRCF